MRGLLLVAMLATGCANVHVNRGALAVSTMLLACDGMQTLHAVGDQHRTVYETNPLMGDAPSASTVGIYFLSAAVINVATWVVMPERFKSVLPTAIGAVQVDSIVSNAPYTGWCGL